MRASNADRERFAKVLHDAMAEGRLTVTEMEERLDQVYAAKTFGELVPVTQDLPGHHRPQSPAVRPAYAAAPSGDRVGGRGTSSNAIAIMSGAERKGVWTVSPTFTAVALMGGVEIDLTHARFEAQETTIQAFSLMGGIEITVPDDITVRVDGSGFMGAFVNHVHTQGPPGSPVVRITGLALMGGVDVKLRKPPRDRDRVEGSRD